jgi:hypothetical protein
MLTAEHKATRMTRWRPGHYGSIVTAMLIPVSVTKDKIRERPGSRRGTDETADKGCRKMVSRKASKCFRSVTIVDKNVALSKGTALKEVTYFCTINHFREQARSFKQKRKSKNEIILFSENLLRKRFCHEEPAYRCGPIADATRPAVCLFIHKYTHSPVSN